MHQKQNETINYKVKQNEILSSRLKNEGFCIKSVVRR